MRLSYKIASKSPYKNSISFADMTLRSAIMFRTDRVVKYVEKQHYASQKEIFGYVIWNNRDSKLYNKFSEYTYIWSI